MVYDSLRFPKVVTVLNKLSFNNVLWFVWSSFLLTFDLRTVPYQFSSEAFDVINHKTQMQKITNNNK